jgi:hypothetical protein
MIKEMQTETVFGVETHIIIDHGNGKFTSMPKAHYQAQQAEQSTPIVTADE